MVIKLTRNSSDNNINHILSLNSNGTTRGELRIGDYLTSGSFLTINAAGNVGIGTTSPNQRLTIAGNINLTGTNYIGTGIGSADTTGLHFLAVNRVDILTNAVTRMTVTSTGNFGIGTTSPSKKFHVNFNNDIYNGACWEKANSASNEAINTLNQINQTYTLLGPNTWKGGGIRYIQFYGRVDDATNYSWSLTNAAVLFTGQHMSYSDTLTQDQTLESKIGLIVVSSGKFKTKIDGIIKTNKNGITINNCHPLINLSNSRQQKNVYGVITNAPDVKHYRKDNGEIVLDYEDYEFERDICGRIRINSSGEGAIWVCNEDGNIENGDYIMSSSLEGYGTRQISEFLANYTVAKITCDLNFFDSELELKHEIRYLQPDGTIITKEQYDILIADGQQAYIAAFVGCTYHCG